MRSFSGLPHYRTDEDVLTFSADDVALVNGIGMLPGQHARSDIFSRFDKLGYEFETVVSANAYVSSHAKLGRGVQVMAGAVVQAGADIGDNSIINSGAVVEHDCVIGAHNHIAPGCHITIRFPQPVE